MMIISRGVPGARLTGDGGCVVDVLVELVDVVGAGRVDVLDEDDEVDDDVLDDEDVDVEVVVKEVDELVVLGRDVVVVDEEVVVVAAVVDVVGCGRTVVDVVVAAATGAGGASGGSPAKLIVTALPRTRTVDGVALRKSSTTRTTVGVNCPVRTRSSEPSSPGAVSVRGARRPRTAPSKSRTMRSGVVPSAASGCAVGRPGGPEKRSRTVASRVTSTCSRVGAASAGMALNSTSTPTHRMFRSYAKR
jgi:hypothetical protein